MKMHCTVQLLSLIVVAVLSLAVPVMTTQGKTVVFAQSTANDLPPLELDALDPYRWSLSELVAAPGQTIRITNRGVMAHTFTVREWGMEVTLPTLETVEITVPTDVQPGDEFTFLCSEPGHQALGQEGTIRIVTPEEILASQQGSDPGSTPDRIVLETRDDFSWSLSEIDVVAGQFIEVVNSGVLEHHFVVDEWGINETISAGEIKLVQVPETVEPGQQFTFYCSVPGHRAGGMEGVFTVVKANTDPTGSGGPGGLQRPTEPDLGRFLPGGEELGTGWSLVRSGDARAVIQNYDNISAKVFPGEGRGATYVGPQGSRATIVVLPFSATGVPTNQVDDAIVNVQLLMMSEWETDLRLGSSLNRLAPPSGCDMANRASGVTKVYTLPAGSTVCQLRSAGIAIFVAVEGQYSEWVGVEAADQVVAKLLQGA